MSKSFKPIFSGGSGRSGTTLVGKILRNHSAVHAGNPYEIKFLTGKDGLVDLVGKHVDTQEKSQNWFNYFGGLFWQMSEGSLNQRQVKNFKEKVMQQWWFRKGKQGGIVGLVQGYDLIDFEREVQALTKEFDTHPVCSARKFFYNFISSHKQFGKSQVVVDTTPTNIERSHEVYSLLPGAKFIHITRDGRDTISSVLREPWGPNEPDKALEWWKRKQLNATSALLHLPTESKLQISLEELVYLNRESTYQKLLTFVGITDEPKMREFFDNEVTKSEAHINRWEEDPLLDENFNQKFQAIVKELNKQPQ